MNSDHAQGDLEEVSPLMGASTNDRTRENESTNDRTRENASTIDRIKEIDLEPIVN